MAHLLTVRKDAFDARDRVHPPTSASVALPQSVSFRSSVAYIKDQGNLGSCTAHAATEMLEMLFRKQKSNLPLSIDRTTLRFSPLFQYAQERMQEGTFHQDAGADSRTIFTVLAKFGCCLEADDAYSESNIYQLPTPAQVVSAKQFTIGAYHRIMDVQTAKSVLASGYTFTIGIPLYNQFDSDAAAATGIIALPSGTSIGGHEMHVVGYDDRKGMGGCFEVQNSWGPVWGDKGFCWIPYEYFTQTDGEWDMWTAHFGKPWVPTPKTAPVATSSTFGRPEFPWEQLANIERNTNQLLSMTRRIMSNLADVDAALGTVDTDVATLITDNAAILAALQAAPQTPDTSAQIAHIQAIDVALKALVSADAAALTPETPPATS